MATPWVPDREDSQAGLCPRTKAYQLPITRYRPPGEYRSTSDPGVDRSRIHRARPACERSSCRAEEAARSRAEGVEAAPGGARAAGQITRLEPASGTGGAPNAA